jgi:hypothetical protein
MHRQTHQFGTVFDASIVFSLLSLLMIALITSEANGGDNEQPEPVITSIVDLGLVPLPERNLGWDGGFSAMLGGRFVWIFGDTFLSQTAGDGFKWRSNPWSWMKNLSSESGLGPLEQALGPDGMALQLLPHTEEEATFNRAHKGHEDCLAGIDCGSRHTPWPNAIVTDSPGLIGVVFYANMHTGPKDEWDFRSVSGSVAIWIDPEDPAVRVEPPLFSDEEPDWGSAALLVNDNIYVYACEFNGSEKPCLLARVPFHLASNRSAYRFWAGDGVWSKDWQVAIPVFVGGSMFSVHFNAYLGRFLAFYMAGMAGEIHLRTASRPEGPWSEGWIIGKGLRAWKNWDYALIAHPEFARENGRGEILSYTRPAGFLTKEVRLLELRFE